MTEELNHHHHEHEHDCLCKSKGFRKFVVVALGSFVGVFCALNLFCALHKPPMMMGPMGYGAFGPQMHCNCPCCHKMMKKHDFDKNFIKHDKDFKGTLKKETDD